MSYICNLEFCVYNCITSDSVSLNAFNLDQFGAYEENPTTSELMVSIISFTDQKKVNPNLLCEKCMTSHIT